MGLLTGTQLKTVRKTLNYTQTDIEELTGIDQTTISKIEKSTGSISSEYYRMFLRGLNMDEGEMLWVFNLIMELQTYRKG